MTISRFDETLPHIFPCLSAEKVAELADIIDQLIITLHPEAIYVFGSQARGDARSDSDVDLLIVVPPTDIPDYRLSQTAYKATAGHWLSVDLIVMPADEFAWRRRSPASLPSTVLREGKLLYAA